MYQFKHEFREIRSTDGYDGCMILPNGDKPVICEICAEDDWADVIVSGSGGEETIVTIITSSAEEYILILPQFNTVVLLVADFIVDKLETGKSNLLGAIRSVADELRMILLNPID